MTILNLNTCTGPHTYIFINVYPENCNRITQIVSKLINWAFISLGKTIAGGYVPDTSWNLLNDSSSARLEGYILVEQSRLKGSCCCCWYGWRCLVDFGRQSPSVLPSPTRLPPMLLEPADRQPTFDN